jgi:hypothetical protein
MNLDCFRRQFHTKVLSRAKELQPLTSIWGTNSPLIQHTINLAVSCMEEGEAYFEVGCLYGSSLDSANKGNDDKIKYCVDMQWQGEMPRLTGTMPNLFYKESKYEDVDLKEFLKHPVGVYYFDGPHDFDPSYWGLTRILNHLADKAIILYDDIDGYGRAFNAWRKFARDSGITIVHEFWTPDQFIACTKGYPDGWWDGFAIAEFERYPERRDESIEDIAIKVWHSTPPYEGRHNFVYPKELKHIHGKEEMHISEYNKQESGFVIKR